MHTHVAFLSASSSSSEKKGGIYHHQNNNLTGSLLCPSVQQAHHHIRPVRESTAPFIQFFYLFYDSVVFSFFFRFMRTVSTQTDKGPTSWAGTPTNKRTKQKKGTFVYFNFAWAYLMKSAIVHRFPTPQGKRFDPPSPPPPHTYTITPTIKSNSTNKGPQTGDGW